MPQIQTEFEEIPAFSELEVNTVLEIVNVEYTKTQKKNLDAFILTLRDGSRRFGTQKGVLYQLKQVQGDITEDDPLMVRVASYHSDKSGKSELTIKNVSA